MVVQCYLFFVRFLLLSKCLSNFFIGRLGFGIGLDSISYLLILLSFWIVVMVIIARQKVYNKNSFTSLFVRVNLLLLLSLVVTFSSLDYLLFYIRFESSLIPTLILVIG